jgi:hypothetical protein
MQHHDAGLLDERLEVAAPVVIPNMFAGYLTEKQYAAQRGVSLRTCQRDRQLRQAPPHVIIGKKIYYRADAVREWMLVRERSDDRSPTAPRARRVR